MIIPLLDHEAEKNSLEYLQATQERSKSSKKVNYDEPA